MKYFLTYYVTLSIIILESDMVTSVAFCLFVVFCIQFLYTFSIYISAFML